MLFHRMIREHECIRLDAWSSGVNRPLIHLEDHLGFSNPSADNGTIDLQVAPYVEWWDNFSKVYKFQLPDMKSTNFSACLWTAVGLKRLSKSVTRRLEILQ